MTGYLDKQQVGQLLRGINPHRVGRRDNQSHLEAYDVRAHLNRIFGFARWSGDVLEAVLLFEDIHQSTKDASKQVVSVGYRATYRLTLFAPDGTVLATYTEVATGDASNFPISKRADAHDFAVKTAESQAFKRCAINLGDQFGLSLYNRGSTEPLVVFALGPDPVKLAGGVPVRPTEQQQDGAVDAHISTPLAPENDTPPADAEPPSEDQAEVVARIRAQALTIPPDTIRPAAYLGRVQLDAARAGVLGALTTDADGNGMTLETLIKRRMDEVKTDRKAS